MYSERAYLFNLWFQIHQDKICRISFRQVYRQIMATAPNTVFGKSEFSQILEFSCLQPPTTIRILSCKAETVNTKHTNIQNITSPWKNKIYKNLLRIVGGGRQQITKQSCNTNTPLNFIILLDTLWEMREMCVIWSRRSDILILRPTRVDELNYVDFRP